MTDAMPRPIKVSFDSTPGLYVAWFRDEYCGCGECKPPLGLGRTREAAVMDLWEQDNQKEEA